jgi:nucleoside-diphosphate-sugar epimerase
MGTTHTETLERQELIRKLIDRGHGPLVDALLSNERQAYTRGGRLNKSAACRLLGWRPAQLERALADCREILAPDLAIE